MKLLHAADLHLDTPFTGRTDEQADFLRRQLLSIPGKLVDLCRKEQCDMMLLSGDLFDGRPSRESVRALLYALEDAAVPVFIAPGNHDPIDLHSPYLTEDWPANVHIFKQPAMEALSLPELDCKVYGAGYRSMDCGSLLEGFRAEGLERYHIGVLHGDPTNAASPYCPITLDQIRESGLDYLALGHIHQGGSLRGGDTLCAWPGCPMGRGYDETGYKGVLIVTLGEGVEVKEVCLDVPAFFDLQTTVENLPGKLSAQGNNDFYRVTLIGEGVDPTLPELYRQYARFPNLHIRDHRTVPTDLWSCADSDSLEGTFFRLLKEAMEAAPEQEQETYALAARISRQLLDGEEVTLP